MQGDHWDLANEAAASAGIALRPLTSLEDADRILEVMVATWGGQEVTREIFRAFQESGNVPYGAFDGGEMVGYVLGWLGTDEGELHVHSHMLAVLEPWRARGVGYALKLAQRAAALDASVRVVRWTFDPMVSRNAYFNFRKLGTVADRFERNFYGEMLDRLNRGDRSDRLLVRWDLDRPLPPGRPAAEDQTPLLDADGPPESPTPLPAADELSPAADWVVALPADHVGLREREPELAQRWRDAVAEALEVGLRAGRLVTGFLGPKERNGIPAYVLSPRDPR